MLSQIMAVTINVLLLIYYYEAYQFVKRNPHPAIYIAVGVVSLIMTSMGVFVDYIEYLKYVGAI